MCASNGNFMIAEKIKSLIVVVNNNSIFISIATASSEILHYISENCCFSGSILSYNTCKICNVFSKETRYIIFGRLHFQYTFLLIIMKTKLIAQVKSNIFKAFIFFYPYIKQFHCKCLMCFSKFKSILSFRFFNIVVNLRYFIG